MGEAQVSGLHLLLALAAREQEDGVLGHLGLDAAAARRTAGQPGTAGGLFAIGISPAPGVRLMLILVL
jgi:hypothetical protein